MSKYVAELYGVQMGVFDTLTIMLDTLESHPLVEEMTFRKVE